jgi:hypothetical protein
MPRLSNEQSPKSRAIGLETYMQHVRFDEHYRRTKRKWWKNKGFWAIVLARNPRRERFICHEF